VWIEYWWPKPGEKEGSRKLAYGLSAKGTPNFRRLAYEAADCGLRSPDLAAGIRRVKDVKKISVRPGNWLTAEQSQRLGFGVQSGKPSSYSLRYIYAPDLHENPPPFPVFPAAFAVSSRPVDTVDGSADGRVS